MRGRGAGGGLVLLIMTGNAAKCLYLVPVRGISY